MLRRVSNRLSLPVLFPTFYPPAYYAPLEGGKIRLTASPADARVFVNGALAGSAERLKIFRLKPGAYDLEVRAKGYESFRERIYILSDKTLTVTARLVPAAQGGKP